MAISDRPWGSISPRDYRDTGAYCGACLIDLNEFQSPSTGFRQCITGTACGDAGLGAVSVPFDGV
jgi:hypothetical protein